MLFYPSRTEGNKGEQGKGVDRVFETTGDFVTAVLVVDGHNVIRHLQVTPDLGHMPDMEKAFQVARSLVKENG